MKCPEELQYKTIIPEPLDSQYNEVPFHAYQALHPSQYTYCSKLHWQANVEMLYLISGNFFIYLDNVLHELHPGDFVFICIHDIHMAYKPLDQSSTMLVIKFAPNIFNNAPVDSIDNIFIFPLINGEMPLQRHYTADQLKGTKIILSLFKIYDEYNQKGFAYHLAIKSYIYSILLEILRMSENGKDYIEQTRPSSYKDIIKNLLHYVYQNYQKSINSKQAAKLCNMSYSGFAKLFKKNFNMTFSQFLNRLRLIEAQKMLISSSISISDIAYQTGFSSSSYFIRQFKKYAGISPMMYKKQHK